MGLNMLEESQIDSQQKEEKGRRRSSKPSQLRGRGIQTLGKPA